MCPAVHFTGCQTLCRLRPTRARYSPNGPSHWRPTHFFPILCHMNRNEPVVSSSPVAVLVAVTKEATLALGGQREARVTQFLFKVGRESRVASPTTPARMELRLGTDPQLNDLYLVEPAAADLQQISREHFAIEYTDNKFFLVDRGSVSGTIVAGKQVGGNRTKGRAELRRGDQIIVGTDGSPYVFRFEIMLG